MSKKIFFFFMTLIIFAMVAKGQDNVLFHKILNEGRIMKGMQPWNIEHGCLLCV